MEEPIDIFNVNVQIAYDRKRCLYIAYNESNNIFATGICVESAIEKYNLKVSELIKEFVKLPF